MEQIEYATGIYAKLQVHNYGKGSPSVSWIISDTPEGYKNVVTANAYTHTLREALGLFVEYQSEMKNI